MMNGVEMAAVEDTDEELTLINDRQRELIPTAFSAELHEEDENMKIQSLQFYVLNRLRGWCLLGLSFCTLGLLSLFLRWFPTTKLRLTHCLCEQKAADAVLITGGDGSATVASILPGTCQLPSHFTFRLVKFWRRSDGQYRPAVFDVARPFSFYHALSRTGLLSEEVGKRCKLFGSNLVDVPLKPSLNLLVDEVLNPFYVFQLWSITIWYLDDYVLYAYAIFFISCSSALLSLVTTKRNLIKLRSMAFAECSVNVLRDCGFPNGATRGIVQVSSAELVPGDCIVVNSISMMPCDAVLVKGTAVVDESMLTGESLPVVKTSLPSSPDGTFHPSTHARCTLFSGTSVAEVRSTPDQPCIAVVIRTGFLTAKGRMVRSILFPKEVNLHFHRDSMRFVGILACIACIGTLLSIPTLLHHGVSTKELFLKACDIVTIAVPAALPAVMVVGVEFALARLRKRGTFCIAPSRLNVAGQIDTVCFDKTGTLTEQGVDVVGVIPVPAFPTTVSGQRTQAPACPDKTLAIVPVSGCMGAQLLCLAACHDLTTVRDELVGDPLDLVMFKATGCRLMETLVREHKGNFIHLPLISSPVAPRGRAPDSGDCMGRDRTSYALSPPASPQSVALDGEDSANNALLSLPSIAHHPGPADDVSPGQRSGVANGEEQVEEAEEEGGLGWLDVSAEKRGWRALVVKRFAFSSQDQRCTVVVMVERAGRVGRGCTGGGQHTVGCSNDEASGADERGGGDWEEAREQHIFVKGAPEVVLGLCAKESFDKRAVERELQTLVQQGLRVLACAHGVRRERATVQDASALSRTVAEQSLHLTGLLVMDNVLKPASTGVVRELTAAHISCSMVTGDHLLTGVHVSRKCGILAPGRPLYLGDVESDGVGGERLEFALAAEEEVLESDEEGKMSRIREHPKQLGLEEMLELMEKDAGDGELGPTDTSCEIALTGRAFEKLLSAGTGSEQCGSEQRQLETGLGPCAPAIAALRVLGRARVLARMTPAQKQRLVEVLAQTEASIAAPFTSAIPDVSPMVDLVREGRCALVTSFCSFKFMAMYSLIQFFTVLRLYTVNASLSDAQFLWIDLVIIVSLAITMAGTAPAPSLSPYPPVARLLSPAVLSSVAGHAIVVITVQALTILLLSSSPAFHCSADCPLPSFPPPSDDTARSEVCEPPFPTCCLSLPLGCPTRPILPEDSANEESLEVSAAFIVSQFQYLAAAVAFNSRSPFRLPSHHNLYYVANLALLFLVSAAFTFTPSPWEQAGAPTLVWAGEQMGIVGPGGALAWQLLGLGLGSTAISLLYERVSAKLWASQQRCLRRGVVAAAAWAGLVVIVVALNCVLMLFLGVTD